MEEKKTSRPRGFAAMSKERHAEICRKGGKAAHAAGAAHEFTSDEARAAGRKGGAETHRRLREKKKSAPPAASPAADKPAA